MLFQMQHVMTLTAPEKKITNTLRKAGISEMLKYVISNHWPKGGKQAHNKDIASLAREREKGHINDEGLLYRKTRVLTRQPELSSLSLPPICLSLLPLILTFREI